MKSFFPILLLALIVVNHPVFAQKELTRTEKPPKGFLAITFGPSLTSGNFGDASWNNENAGFAKNGYQYSILEFGFKFVPKFGMAAAIKGAVIPVNVQALADGYAQEYGGQFTVKSTRWGYTGFFVGPFFCIPTKHVDFDVRFMTGLLMAVSPEATVSRDGQTASQESAIGASFAINGGIGARIHLSKRFSLVTQAEYHLSNPTFQVEYYDTNNNYESVLTGQLITLFNFSFGFALRVF
jgi:hypothetical protein